MNTGELKQDVMLLNSDLPSDTEKTLDPPQSDRKLNADSAEKLGKLSS